MEIHYHLLEIQYHCKNNYNKKKFIKLKLVIVTCCYRLLVSLALSNSHIEALIPSVVVCGVESLQGN